MNLLRRLWVYQSERFPLVKTAPLLAVFSAASINASAILADRPLPGAGAYVTGFLLAFILFFQLRAADEWKDRDTDARFRPERPVPRGLVSLREIGALGFAGVPLALMVAWAQGLALVALLLLVWLWFAAMTFEFGVKRWLVAHPVVYLVSHMAIMPLIDLMLTGVEWAGRHDPAPELWTFLALSLVNGCVLEIGRKCWAPDSERTGVDSYSRLWGPRRAVWVWLGFVALAAVLLAFYGAAIGAFVPYAALAAVGLAAMALVAQGFAQTPTPQAEKRLDTAAGLWVVFSYGTAGFMPLLWGPS